VSTQRSPQLVISTAPFVKDAVTTPRVMLEVLLAALVVLGFAVWNFGVGALLTAVAASAGTVGAEWFFSRGAARNPLKDNSALLTGVLLGLTLPPTMPMWMAFLGGFVGIGLGKLIWGGLGQNLFNPALVGRAFLQASFPTAITTWAPTAGGDWTRVLPSQLAAPLMHGVDGVTAATPLGLMKFEHHGTDAMNLLLGNVPGSLGETSALVLIILGVIMASRRLFDWRLPVSTVLTVFVFSGIVYLIDPAGYPSPWFMVLSGGLLFGAVFMVTDPVTTPMTPKGAWIFGLGVGVLVVLIRLWGGLPEGVMYAILLMNAVTPHINRYTVQRPFGG